MFQALLGVIMMPLLSGCVYL